MVHFKVLTLGRVYTGSRRELARVFVSFFLTICPNSSRLTVYTGLRVNWQFLCSGQTKIMREIEQKSSRIMLFSNRFFE